MSSPWNHGNILPAIENDQTDGQKSKIGGKGNDAPSCLG